ncbi:hypothetical protein C2S51_023097 [Perilla frutescens var. frutescens]|nr:hypothetical protein C2S51_023097 [Perilla frutescens var. frutescens]
MFDLNLTIDSNDDDKFNINASNCDGCSPETSAGNGGGESTSSNDDTCSIRATSASFNHDSNDLNSDRGLTSTESTSLVTRDLFPLSRLDELDCGRLAVQQGLQQVQAVQARKSRRGPRSRSSQYRGVTFYRRTGRWESHIWDCGKQVYLGGFDTALAAARAYDRAAIKFRGVEADINFNLSDYEDMKQMMNLSKEEFVQLLRRGSTGFSRGNSKYRGVTLYKGGLEKKAYEKAAVVCNGSDAVANFERSAYNGDTISEPRNGYGGSRHDLNLNLGMPASSVKEGECLDSSKLHHEYDAQTTKTIKLHALEGVPLTSQHPIFRIGVGPIFVPNNEERETSGSISQLEVANLGWRMPGHVRMNSNTTFATAASSGFSSPAPSSAASPNTLACYSWMKPFSPPS